MIDVSIQQKINGYLVVVTKGDDREEYIFSFLFQALLHVVTVLEPQFKWCIDRMEKHEQGR